MPQSPEGLTALQQNRLEAARGRVLDLRNQVADEILEAAGLEKSGKENYSIHLGRIEAWDDDNTAYQLNEMGLVEDGILTVPVVAVSSKDGDIEQIVKDDRLRLKFKFMDGDTVAVPFFILGYEENKEFKFLSDLWLRVWSSGNLSASAKREHIFDYFPVSKNLDEPNLKCLGITVESVFGVTLPEGAKLLFNKAGWMKTEKELEPLIDFMARRVDLEYKRLSALEKQRFTEALALLRNNAIAINDWLGNEFKLVEDVYKHLMLDGDIEVEALRLTDPEHPSLKGTIICIRNILLPEPDSEVVWFNLVRPKADSLTGTLKIIIYSDGDFSGKVEIGGVEQKGYNTENLLTTENLAAILAKTKVE